MKKEALYREFAKYYDLIYKDKKYDVEVNFINKILKKHKAKSVLEFACGTGGHAKLLSKKGYRVFGVDKNPAMLKIAKKKVPKALFTTGDMRSFKAKRRFDAVLCLFSAVNYNLTMADFIKTLKNFKRHIKNNGAIIFDTPVWQPHELIAEFVTKDLIVIYDRIDKGNISEMIIYWVFRKKGKVKVVKDSHLLRFYPLKEINQALKKAGLKRRIYWDWSSKTKGKRPIIVCWK